MGNPPPRLWVRGPAVHSSAGSPPRAPSAHAHEETVHGEPPVLEKHSGLAREAVKAAPPPAGVWPSFLLDRTGLRQLEGDTAAPTPPQSRGHAEPTPPGTHVHPQLCGPHRVHPGLS